VRESARNTIDPMKGKNAGNALTLTLSPGEREPQERRAEVRDNQTRNHEPESI